MFDPKLIHEKPTLINKVSLKDDARIIHVLREGTFTLCYQKRLEHYLIDEVKGIRLMCQKSFDIPNENTNLFQVPQPF